MAEDMAVATGAVRRIHKEEKLQLKNELKLKGQ